MLLLLDRSERWYQAGGKILTLTALLLLLVAGSVFLFFWRLARTTEATLQQNRQQLLEEHARISESNRVLTQTEERLRHSNERLCEAQRIAHLGSWDWDILHNQLYWTAEVYHIFGLAPSDTPLSYERFLHTIPAGERDKVDRQVQQALQGGGEYAVEHTLIRPVHTTRVVQERGEVIMAEGRPVRMMCTVHDITEQRCNEQQMAHLGHLFDNASNEIYLITVADFTILQANRTATTHLGYSGSELTRLNYLAIATELTTERLHELAAPLQANSLQEVTFDTLHTRKGGGNYPVEVRLQRSQMDGPVVYLAIVLDISERVAQLHELHYRETHDSLTALPNRHYLMSELEPIKKY